MNMHKHMVTDEADSIETGPFSQNKQQQQHAESERHAGLFSEKSNSSSKQRVMRHTHQSRRFECRSERGLDVHRSLKHERQRGEKGLHLEIESNNKRKHREFKNRRCMKISQQVMKMRTCSMATRNKREHVHMEPRIFSFGIIQPDTHT
jgi:hypothetical protein